MSAVRTAAVPQVRGTRRQTGPVDPASVKCTLPCRTTALALTSGDGPVGSLWPTSRDTPASRNKKLHMGEDATW
jgi:hypothetical protein